MVVAKISYFRNSNAQFLGLVVFVLVFFSCNVAAVSVEEDLSMTLEQKKILDKFMDRMSPVLPHGYMKTYIYLVRWLRARNWNLDAAEEMLKANLKWRGDNKIEELKNRDWSVFEEDYPYTLDTVDKAGRPIGVMTVGQWDIRRSAVTGKMPEFRQFLFKVLEDITQLVFKKQGEGQNVTQWKAVVNLEGFNIVQHACILCLQTYAAFFHVYEAYYPQFIDELIMVNMPGIFQVILNVIMPIFTPPTRKALKLLGTDKQQWLAFLDETISKDQRRADFGGTKAD